MVALVWKSRG